jgi:hypothetical protein
MKHKFSIYENNNLSKDRYIISPYRTSRDGINSPYSKQTCNYLFNPLSVNSTINPDKSTRHSRNFSMVELISSPKASRLEFNFTREKNNRFIREYTNIFQNINKKDVLAISSDSLFSKMNESKLKHLSYNDKLDLVKLRLFSSQVDNNFNYFNKDKGKYLNIQLGDSYALLITINITMTLGIMNLVLDLLGINRN